MTYKIVEGDTCNELHEFDEETREYRKVGETDLGPAELDDAVHIYKCEREWENFTLLETYEDFGDDSDRAFIE